MKNSLAKFLTVLLCIFSGCSNDNPSEVVVDFIYAVENKKFIPYQSNASNTYHPTFNNTQTLSNFNASKLSLEIKNIGTTQVMFGGSIIDVGSSITINNLSNTYYIDLPANLVQMINSQNETIITTAKYELTLKAVETVMYIEYDMGWEDLPEQEEIEFVTKVSDILEDKIKSLSDWLKS